MNFNPFGNKPEPIETTNKVFPANPETSEQPTLEQFKTEDQTFQLVQTELIDDPEDPIRSGFDEVKLNELVLSIKQTGLIEPIVLKPNKGRFEVIAGHRRLKASRIAGLKSVPAMIKRIGNDQSEVMKLHENMYREDISPWDEANYFNKLIQIKKISPAKVAALIGKSPTYVSERLAIFNYPDELREALNSGKITFSSAREFARHPDPEKIKQFTRYAISNGITPNVARQWVRDDVEASKPRNPEGNPDPSIYDGETPAEQGYPCFVDGQIIPIAELSVVYMHSKCHHDLGRAIKETDPTPEPAAAARA